MVLPVVLAQFATTLLMTGIIWFVQIVHYPLFARVGASGFAQYSEEHATRTGWVVGPLMVLELGTALLLLSNRFRPASLPLGTALLGAVLLGGIWLSTALLQIPRHTRLALGYDRTFAVQLVTTNWIRTVCWTARCVLLLNYLARTWRF